MIMAGAAGAEAIGGGGGGEGEIILSAGSYGGGGGGGGGSFVGGTVLSLVGGVRAGNGEVDIIRLVGGGAPAPVPEPSTWALMATGFAALGLAGLRRRRKA